MAKRKARKQGASAAQTDLLQVSTTTAPAVAGVRRAVESWRADGYAGISDTTRTLLEWWFPKDGHRRGGGRVFRYHPFQRDAIETLIYLYEVAGKRRQKELLESFVQRPDVELLQHDDFARYCLKMATGSGKTKVMSLAIARQYFASSV